MTPRDPVAEQELEDEDAVSVECQREREREAPDALVLTLTSDEWRADEAVLRWLGGQRC